MFLWDLTVREVLVPKKFEPVTLSIQTLNLSSKWFRLLERRGTIRTVFEEPLTARSDTLYMYQSMHQFLRSLTALIPLALCLSANVQGQARYGQHGAALLPDPTVTPGAIAISSKTTVCTTKWGKDARHVTAAMKKQVYAQYGTAPGIGVCAWKTRTTKAGKIVREACEVDHLVSRELGGADDVRNLWPQPYTQHPGAHEKDWLENRLHAEVCSGKITLQDVQNQIQTDWYAAYLQRKSTPNP